MTELSRREFLNLAAGLAAGLTARLAAATTATRFGLLAGGPEQVTVAEAIQVGRDLLAESSNLLDRAEAFGDPVLTAKAEDVMEGVIEYVSELKEFVDSIGEG